jgi:hypothetical protein
MTPRYLNVLNIWKLAIYNILQSVKHGKTAKTSTDVDHVAQAMDFPDLSEMDLDHWNGDLKLGSGVGQSKLIMSCGKASHKPSHTIPKFPSLTSMGVFYKHL